MIVAKKKDDKYTTEITLSKAHSVRPVYAGLPEKSGGLSTDFRPSQLVLAGYAACASISVRSWLSDDNVEFEDVIVSTKMEVTEDGKTKIFTKIEIVSDIPQEQKDIYIQRAKSCTVSKILRSEKEFLDME